MIGTNKTTLIGLTFAAATGCLAYVAVMFQFQSIDSENSILENSQVVFLAAAALGYFLIPPLQQDTRLINIAISLLCVSFALRELDVEYFNIPDFFIVLGSGTGKKILLAVLWLALIVYSFAAISNKVVFIKQFVGSPIFAILTVAFLLLLAGGAMDKNIFDISHARLLEELAETNAYFIIALPVFVRAAHWMQQAIAASFSTFIVMRQAANQSDH
ncbi:MAG: hypothetical protein ACI95C_002860 [Pseudohongiellaceae bacterium]|jgi:hypothetical protein